MDVALYTGNGSTQTISGLEFSPDFVWVKARNAAYSHRLWDVVRGATKGLLSDGTDAEFTEVNGLTAFNADGFSVGTGLSESAKTYVAWTWDAGSSTVTNNDGSITSSVRANPSAGFSIVGYTGNATTGATFGHGLNVPPSLVIVKNRDTATNWCVGHVSAGFTKYLELNTTIAATSASSLWNNTNPSSTVVTLGSDTLVNQSTKNHVAYCFAPVAGYSSFGSYTGNGSADGPFVFTGFKVKFILLKQSSAAGERWYIQDVARDINSNDAALYPNSSDAESSSTAYAIDFLSNGFKLRNTNGSHNTSGATYIYAAFAEHPFQYARAR
jgi:hypothetical protein